LLTIIPVKGIPDIELGDNLGEIIVARLKNQGEEFQEGDVTVVSQKIVSKTEGRVVNLSKVTPSLSHLLLLRKQARTRARSK